MHSLCGYWIRSALYRLGRFANLLLGGAGQGGKGKSYLIELFLVSPASLPKVYDLPFRDEFPSRLLISFYAMARSAIRH